MNYTNMINTLERIDDLEKSTHGDGRINSKTWFKLAILAIYAICYALAHIADCCSLERR